MFDDDGNLSCEWCHATESETEIKKEWDDHKGDSITIYGHNGSGAIALCRQCFYESQLEEAISDLKEIYRKLAEG